jgi:hypothetical protein
MLLTTTAERPDEELANRCLVVSANEHPRHTAAIHRRQRLTFQQTIATASVQTLVTRQQHAQRLLQPLRVSIPWADRLTFRTDQVRYRRDHAKYLSLIASITLLHQYQRQQVRCSGRGSETVCVVASLEDLELANQLATAVLGEPVDSLLPGARQLWIELTHWVSQRAQQQGLDVREVRFTQRELREALQRSDRALRRHLATLVELEYVVAQRTGRGNLRAYQLAYAGRDAAGAISPLGLVDVECLRQAAKDGVSRNLA